MGFGFISIIKVTVIISIKRGPYQKEAKRDTKINTYFKLFQYFHSFLTKKVRKINWTHFTNSRIIRF